MATYIMGNDVHVWFREASNQTDTLAVSYQHTDPPYWDFLFSGIPAVGDEVTLHLEAVGGSVYDNVFVADSDVLSDLLTQIRNAVNATGGFSAASFGDDSEGLHIGPVSAGSVSGNISVAPFQPPFSVLACTKSDVLNLENEMIEVTEIDVRNTNFIPSFQGLTISIEQAVVMDATGQISITEIQDWALDQTRLDYSYEMARPDAVVFRKITGQCYIKSASIQGGVNTGALATFEIACVGTPTVQNL